MSAPEGWSIFDWAAKISSVGVAVLLGLSVVYDYSFLLALGLQFSEVPTTITDHVRSAIIWVLPLGVSIAAGMAYHLFLKRIEGGKSEKELVASSPTPAFTRAFRVSADVAAFVTVSVMSVSILLFEKGYSGMYPVTALFWFVIANSIVGHPRMGERLKGVKAMVFTFGPCLVALVGWAGYFAGEKLLTAKKAGWEVSAVFAQGPKVVELAGLRRFEGVVVAVDMERKVHLLPADAVKHATEIGRELQDKPNMCLWFGWACGERGS